MTMEIWYNQKPSSDLGPGDPPILVNTTAELDAFIDRFLRETKDGAIPSMIQVAIVGDHKWKGMEVGIGQEMGFVNYHAPGGGGVTMGDPTRTGWVPYDYMAHTNEIEAWAEIPVELVRQGLREYLATNGAKPVSLPWRPDEEED